MKNDTLVHLVPAAVEPDTGKTTEQLYHERQMASRIVTRALRIRPGCECSWCTRKREMLRVARIEWWVQP